MFMDYEIVKKETKIIPPINFFNFWFEEINGSLILQ